MPKKHRLSRADFVRISRGAGQRVHGTYFSLTATTLPPGNAVKAACVVSKKISKRAIDRNKIERRVREVLRPLIARIAGPHVLVFYAKREATAASYAEIERDIQKLIDRIR